MSSEWAEQPANADNHGVPGRALAAQREALGWTVEQVADQLKLAVRQVVALEAGDYAALPGPAVVRGFVRAYAKIVKLDAVPLVAMISLDSPGPGDAGGTHLRRDNKPAAFSEVRFPTGKRTALPLVPIAAVVLVLAAAAAAWHFGLVQRVLNRGETPAVSAPAGSVAAPNVSVLPAPVASGAAPAAPPVELNALQNPSVPLISVPPPTSSTAGSPAAAGAGANSLVVNVREDSWIEVRRAKGAPLISRLVKGGTTESFEVTEPVTLVVGKPSAVSATLRGAAVVLPPVAGSAVSRVNLK
ncbi:MAG: Helix-turn-helix protein [Massilia sp.]|nr:Helix-turn-helix protein [Massilia sp.]